MANSQINVQLQLEGVSKFQGDLKQVRGSLRALATGFKGLEKQARDNAAATGTMFRGEMLSVLFFGMQMQRMFKQVTVSSTKFFMEVTEGQTMAGQAMTRLSASVQFLKFTLGDAIATTLMPLIPTIVDITDKVSNWVEQNPKLSSSLLITGLAAGTALLVFGSLGLGLSGLAQTVSFLLVPAFQALQGSLAFLGGGSMLAGAAIGGLITLIIVGFGILMKLNADFRNSVGGMFAGVWGVIKNFGLFLWAFINGDFAGAWGYGELVVLNFAKTIISTLNSIANFASLFVTGFTRIILEPFVKIAEAIDFVNGLAGDKTNYAGRVREMANIASASAGSPLSDLFGGATDFLNSNIASVQGRIDAGNAQANVATNPTENTYINNVNVYNPEDLNRLIDEMKRQQGAIRGANIR